MDYFLLEADYLALIRQDKLDIVDGANDVIRQASEKSSEEEARGYIRNRYNVDLIFAPLQGWATATTFYWGDRIYLTATAFSAVTVYITGDLVSQSGNVYRSTAGSAAHAFNVAEWTLIGAVGHYQMEADLWDDETVYVTNDIVKYETTAVRVYYKALAGNTNVDPYNDNGTNWIEIESQAGQLPTSAVEYWIAGDSRNPLLVRHMVDMTLYHLHSGVNARNIPEFRIDRYKDAVQYFKDIARGLVQLDISIIVPEQGNNIGYGSQPINNNYY